MKPLRDTLFSALILFDAKQAARPGYNRFAMPQYLQRLDEVMADIDAGAPVREAIVAGFNGRLAAALLKAAGQSAYTHEDGVGGVFYSPVKAPQ
jgi:hypothetical protein